VLTFVAVGVVVGHNPSLRRSASSTIRSGFAVLDSQKVRSYSHGQFTNIVFLHHSVGYNLIEQGGIRQKLSDAGLSFWDHGYNWQRLRRPDGGATSYSYNVPDDNTDPDGLARIFAQSVYGLPLNTFSGLLQHEVIIFKSCFPVSNITDDQQLARHKTYYLGIRDVVDKHLDKIFIILTPPPLNPAETNTTAATRAKEFANWLKSDEYLKGHPNLFTFDLFGQLAEDDTTSPDHDMLRKAYREGLDSHPNQLANETVAPLFVDFAVNSIQHYRSGYSNATQH